MRKRDVFFLPCFLLVLAASLRAAEKQPVNVLVAYYSETGHTEKMAGGIVEGAKSVEASEVVLKKITDVTTEDVLRADAIVLGSPVHMGDIAVEMRKAMVAWGRDFGFYESRELVNKVGGVFATGGAPSNGKEFSMMSMALTMLQMGVVIVSPYGGLGASATTAVPRSDRGVDEGELGIARELGRRVVEVARRMRE